MSLPGMVTKQVDLLVATTNPKKLTELQALLTGLPIRLQCLRDYPKVREVPETGKTFEDNAKLKALGYAEQTGIFTLAEDSGLCCDALEGAPGVYSARFAGLDKSDDDNNRKLLRLMEKLPDNCRGARFISTIALAEPGRVIGIVSGEVHGVIFRECRGAHGFGYDPLFYYPPFEKTFGEVPLDRKQQVSHRSRALEKARAILARYLQKG